MILSRSIDDSILFTQLQNDSMGGQRYLYQLTVNEFVNYGLKNSRHTKDELMEVYHDSYLKFINMIKNGKYVYDGRLPIKNFFFVVFKRVLIDDYRKNIKNDALHSSSDNDTLNIDKEKVENANEWDVNIEDEYFGFEKDVIYECLKKSLVSINESYREVITDNYFNNQSIADLARIRKTTDGYAKQLRKRAMDALRDLMFNCMNKIKQ